MTTSLIYTNDVLAALTVPAEGTKCHLNHASAHGNEGVVSCGQDAEYFLAYFGWKKLQPACEAAVAPARKDATATVISFDAIRWAQTFAAEAAQS